MENLNKLAVDAYNLAEDALMLAKKGGGSGPAPTDVYTKDESDMRYAQKSAITSIEQELESVEDDLSTLSTTVGNLSTNAVLKTQIATKNNVGVVQLGQGLINVDNKISTDEASTQDINSGTSHYKVITPNSLAAVMSAYGITSKTDITALKNFVSGYNVYASYASPVLFPSGADLNTYTTPGAWKADSGSLAKTLTNTPYNATGFRMEVKYIHTQNYLTQIIYPGTEEGGRHFYMRNRYTGTWGHWYEYGGTQVEPLSPASAASAMAMNLDDEFETKELTELYVKN